MLIPDIGWYGESVRLGNRRFSVGLFEGLQNLFRGISKGRSDDSDKLPVVSSVGLDESDGTLRFTVADDQMQVDMIWNLLSEQIGERRNKHLPKPLPDPDDLFRPVLVGGVGRGSPCRRRVRHARPGGFRILCRCRAR